MSWANLDDRLHAHPKVRKLQRIPFAGAEAFGIWAWCLSWCRAYHPDDGLVVVDEVAFDWNADPEHMAEVFALLSSVGLVDAAEPGQFAIHDWADWQMDQHVRAGKARAESAQRGDNGRFVTSALDPLVSAGESAGTPAGHASPRHSTPRLTSGGEDGPKGNGMTTAYDTAKEVAATLFRPVPEPARAKR